MAKAKIEKQEEARLKQLQTEDDPNPLPPPPDGGYGWVIVFASLVSNTIVDGVGYSFGLILPYLIDQFGTSKGTTAWVGSILLGFQMGAGPLASAVANKYGCRTTSITGAILAAASVALSTLSPNVVVMMFLYGVFGGIGYSFLYLPAVVMVGYYFEKKRSLATGISVCGTGIGAFTFAPLVNSLLINYGWKTTNFYLAGITLSGIFFGALMKPLKYEETVVENVPQQQTRASEGNISAPGIYNSNMSITKRKASLQPMARADVLYTGSIQNLKEYQSKTSLAEYRHSVHSIQKPKNLKSSDTSCSVSEFFSSLVDFTILREPAFIVFAASSIFGMAALYVPITYLAELAKTKGLTETQGSMLISIIGGTNIVARIIIGLIADVPCVNNFLVTNCCLLLSAAAVAIMPLCSTFATLAGISIFYAIGVAGYISLTSIILVEFLGLDKLTNAFGLLILFRGIAASFGSPLAGTLYDLTNSYTIPFFVGGAGFGLAGLINMSLPCFSKKTEEKDVEVLTPLSVREEKNNVV